MAKKTIVYESAQLSNKLPSAKKMKTLLTDLKRKLLNI